MPFSDENKALKYNFQTAGLPFAFQVVVHHIQAPDFTMKSGALVISHSKFALF